MLASAEPYVHAENVLTQWFKASCYLMVLTYNASP